MLDKDAGIGSAACIQRGLSVIKEDKRFIVRAVGKAEKAVTMIPGQWYRLITTNYAAEN